MEYKYLKIRNKKAKYLKLLKNETYLKRHVFIF